MIKETALGNFFVYITTDEQVSSFEVYATGNFKLSLEQLRQSLQSSGSSCTHIVYWEVYADVDAAIARETILRKLSKKRKLALINQYNPELVFLNEDIAARYF